MTQHSVTEQIDAVEREAQEFDSSSKRWRDYVGTLPSEDREQAGLLADYHRRRAEILTEAAATLRRVEQMEEEIARLREALRTLTDAAQEWVDA